MFARALVALMLAAPLPNALFAQGTAASIKIGDPIQIEMSGELVKEYGRVANMLPDPVPERFSISVIARVEEMQEDGRLRIEHSSYVKADGKPLRLVTLSGWVDSRPIATGGNAQGALVYTTPGATGRPAASESKWKRLELAELKGLKLRSWALTEELGN